MIEIACGEAEVQACTWKAYIYNWFATFYGAKGMYCGYGWVQGVNNDVTLEKIHWLFHNSMAFGKGIQDHNEGRECWEHYNCARSSWFDWVMLIIACRGFFHICSDDVDACNFFM